METITELISPHVPGILKFVLIVVASVWLFTYAFNNLQKLRQRWRDNEGGHPLLQPRTWFQVQPRMYFKIKSKILANRSVRELYAPTPNYVRDLREKEWNLNLAWLSPFPMAVRTAISEAFLPKNKKLIARRQIAEVAKRIQVRPLPPGIHVGNKLGDADAPKDETDEQREKRIAKQKKINLANHFRIDLDVTGEDPAVIEKLEANLKTQLDLNGGIERYNSGSAICLSYMAHREKMVDLMTETKVGVSFFADNPAVSPYAIPLAITSEIRPWIWETHHTLIFGMTGSGKGSPIQGAIHQLAPMVEKGTAKLHGIDPKNAELRVYNEWQSSLFERISVGMDEEDMRAHAETIRALKVLIGQRSKHGKKTSITKGEEDDGRDFEASVENPLVLFIIDEFPTLFKGFEQLPQGAGKQPLSDLAQVILTGRSYGVYILAATQRGDKAILDSIVDSMQHKICLRQSNPYFNKLFLGDDYLENGCDPARIPKATKNNGYKTAGIGYVADDEGQSKIRFAYISKVEISELVRHFRALDGNPADEQEFIDFQEAANDWVEFEDTTDDGAWLEIPADAERENISLEDFVLEEFVA